jgi:S-formylglutathione hydrolase
MPDTSPRNDDSIPDVDSYDLGIGAGFYINATAAPYNQHYHMYDYITKELPSILSTTLNIGKDGLKSISGHSMGGHGALTIALKNGVTEWKSVSAFSPICNPTNVPWGEKAFKAYLGSIEAGKAYDATCILEGLTGEGGRMLSYDNILIDQGTADNFLEEQLKPQVLVDAGQKVGQKITLNMRNGFDHSYYFIAAFIESHVEYHGRYLNQASKR